jgi:hypothetical protein
MNSVPDADELKFRWQGLKADRSLERIPIGLGLFRREETLATCGAARDHVRVSVSDRFVETVEVDDVSASKDVAALLTKVGLLQAERARLFSHRGLEASMSLTVLYKEARIAGVAVE